MMQQYAEQILPPLLFVPVTDIKVNEAENTVSVFLGNRLIGEMGYRIIFQHPLKAMFPTDQFESIIDWKYVVSVCHDDILSAVNSKVGGNFKHIFPYKYGIIRASEKNDQSLGEWFNCWYIDNVWNVSKK